MFKLLRFVIDFFAWLRAREVIDQNKRFMNFVEEKRAKKKCANYLRECEGRCLERNCGTASVGRQNTKISCIKVAPYSINGMYI